jgi:hypothetical protein
VVLHTTILAYSESDFSPIAASVADRNQKIILTPIKHFGLEAALQHAL